MPIKRLNRSECFVLGRPRAVTTYNDICSAVSRGILFMFEGRALTMAKLLSFNLACAVGIYEKRACLRGIKQHNMESLKCTHDQFCFQEKWNLRRKIDDTCERNTPTLAPIHDPVNEGQYLICRNDCCDRFIRVSCFLNLVQQSCLEDFSRFYFFIQNRIAGIVKDHLHCSWYFGWSCAVIPRTLYYLFVV